jgi:hypothetical protein
MRAPPAMAAAIMPRVNFSGWICAVVRVLPSCCWRRAPGATQSGSPPADARSGRLALAAMPKVSRRR